MTHSLDEVLDARLTPIVDDAAELGIEVASLRADVNRLQANRPPAPQPEPQPPPEPIPEPDPTPGKTTDLGLNLSHYRYTKHISVDPFSPTGYRVNSADFIALHSQFGGPIRVMNHTAQMTARKRNKVWGNRITDADEANWDKTGLPIEALIETANACKADIQWIYPQQCDNQFMVEAGKLFNRLFEGHVYLETPNECWDSGRGWFYHGNAGGDWGEGMRLFAVDAKDKFARFLENFTASRCTRIIGGQLHNLGVLKRNVIPHLDNGDWDMLTVSGYFGNRPDNWIHGSGGFNRTIEMLEAHAQLAADHGKRMGIYEINQSINVETSDFQLVDSVDVQRHIRAVVDKCRSLDASPICVYSGAGRRYPGQPWPVFNTSYRPQGPTVATLDLPTI